VLSERKPGMDIPNAFVGKKTAPSASEMAAKLGPSTAAWNELVDWLETHKITCTAWKSVSPRYGWSLRPELKNLLYLGPCDGCFHASFALDDRAVAAARANSLPESVIREPATARRYAEGTGVRLIVRKAGDLEAVRKLVLIRLEN
jgi:hypothetical protein